MSSRILSLVANVVFMAPQGASAATPVPRDVPYAGTIALDVDATDLAHGIYRVHERLPAKAGPLTLLYPKWLPGTHAPEGPIDAFSGLLISGSGKRIEWKRDPVNAYAFHVSVPPGVTELDMQLEYLAPLSGQPTVRPEMLRLDWNTVVLYPAGYYGRQITVAASLKLPAGWSCATSLEREGPATDDHGAVSVQNFRPISLEMLIDSPVLAGQYYRRVDLDPGAKRPVFLDIVADEPDELNASAQQIDAHRRLVQEAYRVFGSQHFAHYDFLLSISKNFHSEGIEHHRSSANGVRAGYFKDWDNQELVRALLPHEFTHSWNGKFRRPADLWTPSPDVPMQGSLLWVYEGMTEYWGDVLAARSGLRAEPDARAALARVAAKLDTQRAGRVWRNLQDTTNEPIIFWNGNLTWVDWQRSSDYYQEGALIWLDADTKIRELTQDRRSLDDFANAFLGVDDGRETPLTYTFADVVKGLNSVAPYDWAEFLRFRLDNHNAGAPLDGLARAGWRVVYRDKPTGYLEQADALGHATDVSFSIGLVLDKEGKFAEVVWDGPAFKAGAAPGQTLEAVDGKAFTPDRLRQVIRDAHEKAIPIELLVKKLDSYYTLKVDYTGGLRYPDLERIDGTPDRLSAILKPREQPSQGTDQPASGPK